MALLIAMFTVGQLPIGPSTGPAATVLILGSHGVAVAAASGSSAADLRPAGCLDVPVTVVGLLHTSAAHIPIFRALLAEYAPTLGVSDTVDESLLDDARTRGIDNDVLERLERRLRDLRDREAAVILCTCSTLGGAAERLAGALRIPVIRVDRPMAELAAGIGGRVAVVVALASTLEPTRELLSECIARSRRDSRLIDCPCFDAWARFEAGDVEGYLELVAARARAAAADADVIVLAQASMAGAVQKLADLPVPVLTSPSTAVQYAADLAQI